LRIVILLLDSFLRPDDKSGGKNKIGLNEFALIKELLG
jgi:hypothetical protein